MVTLGIAIVSLAYAICVAGMAWGIWGLVCNSRVARDRERIIDVVFTSPDWVNLRRDYHSVSYNDHLLAVMLRRDPFVLYPNRLRKVLEASA